LKQRLKKLVQTRSLWSTKIKGHHPSGFVIWTVGTRVVSLCVRLKQNQRGQLTTTPTLQVDHPEIFALGDLADCRDAKVSKSQRRLKLPPTSTMLVGISGFPD